MNKLVIYIFLFFLVSASKKTPYFESLSQEGSKYKALDILKIKEYYQKQHGCFQEESNTVYGALLQRPFTNTFLVQSKIHPDSIRLKYLKTGENIELRSKFLNYFIENKPLSAFEEAYYATAITMYSEVAKGKLNQFNYFKKGRAILDTIIVHNPENAEFRYLRFDIQIHAPRFLRYNNRNEDIQVILQNLTTLEKIKLKSFKARIKEVLIDSGKLTDEQINIVNQKL